MNIHDHQFNLHGVCQICALEKAKEEAKRECELMGYAPNSYRYTRMVNSKYRELTEPFPGFRL